MEFILMLRRPNDRKPNQWWLVLLLAPFIGVLWVPFFNRIQPQLWGIPFFFWYQFLWVLISAIVTALVYFNVAPRLQPTKQKQQQQESRR
jgi:membrane protein implicated in regulation of membrane protease activity